ncbi:MAG: efflux RND transporter permease subunit [Planctomycetota bacterium]|nr:efflux RND transporter permease subunit [Planctomycetota bacterium]
MNGAIRWFANNPVTANLLMVFIVLSGMITAPRIRQSVFPEFSADIITVSVVYLGAAPEEVEEAVCVRIEEAIRGLDGIKRITSTAAEGVGAISVELLLGTDPRELLDDIKNRVDAIDTFPEETERPLIQEVVYPTQVIEVAISGDVDEVTLRKVAERVRDDILAIPGITQADLAAARPYEVSIEVSETALRRHSLTFDDVARAVRRSSLDLPGGSVKTGGGEILLRTKGQAYRKRQFEDLVLWTHPDGHRLLLGDVADVVDGFEDTDQTARFDGERAVLVQVFRVGEESALGISASVKEYVDEAQRRMPEGITLTTWQDEAKILRGRLDLLLRNGKVGLLLVFVVLTLFLRLRLAFWVTIGIPISFLGAIWMMPGLDVSVNIISLFAFILVLGIVVDDAIIVGESIYRHQQEGLEGIAAAEEGTLQVSKPVIFAVLTSVAAFGPLLMIPGTVGKFIRVIPLIVMPTLLFSLIESLLVLPAHLSHYKKPSKTKRPILPVRLWIAFQGIFSNGLETIVGRVYRPVLERALRWRYLSVSIGMAMLVLTVGMVQGGWVKVLFFPPVDADNAVALLTMPQGTSAEVTAEAIRRLEASARRLRKELEAQTGHDVFQHVLASVGEQPFRAAQSRGQGVGPAAFRGGHLGEVNIELLPSEERGNLKSDDIAKRWRELTGPIPDAVELTYTSSIFSTGEAINIQLTGRSVDRLREAATELKGRLARYTGVFDISDSFRAGKSEIRLKIKPGAEALGLTLSDLARQVRQGFYGEEAQRIQRGRDDVRVMVRYPSDRRRSLGDLENMRIRTPDGGEVPFPVVAEAEIGRGYANIKRADNRRAINVTADVDESQPGVTAGEILGRLAKEDLAEMMENYPELDYTVEGEGREQAETMGGVFRGIFFVALPLIYILIAIPFRSYIQPLIVMSAIPFGLVGAVWGHIIMGMELSIMSMFGLVALSGVVVNDSLVMVDFINRKRWAGVPLEKAVRDAGAVRFRPILLTSLTTFAGVTPLLLEKSVQAKFLIPMAISLGFGVIFATFITLILIPSAYIILEDMKSLMGIKGSDT